MVYNPDLFREKQRFTAILVADLSPEQLNVVQEDFGLGATLCSPHPAEELFIHDKRAWSTLSHAEMKRAYPDTQPLLVIDAKTPEDGGIWYLDHFADEDEVEDGSAESTNTLQKIRMGIKDVVILYMNYDIGNSDIREDMDQVDIPLPTPEQFDQEELHHSGLDPIGDRYISPTSVTATPDEIEESTDEEALRVHAPPRPNVVYRLKPDVARQHGLKSQWSLASQAKDIELPDGTVLKFSEGSKVLNVAYDPETAVPKYQKPEGSL